MKNKPASVSVLVVGAGPTGLTAATELARRGVRVRIIDKLHLPSDKSRALVVHARSLELFQKMGISDELIAIGSPTLKGTIFVKGKKRVDLECGDLAINDTPYPFALFVSQVETERVLEAALEKHGVKVERFTELVTLNDDGEHVHCAVKRQGAKETIIADYVIGCDGAHSAVRHALDVTFEGAAYPQTFLLADVAIDWEFQEDRFRMFLGKKDLLACFPMKKGVMRLIGTRPSDDLGEDETPSLEYIETFARDVSGRELSLRDPIWITRFRLHHRGVNHYRQGRCFLAGDAAHIHSPAGGQGMNTGIQDAYNLAWKLALVTSAKAPESILESYHAERYPVGRFLLRFTDRLFQFGSSPNRLILLLRNMVFPRVARFILAKASRRSRALRTITQLGIRYGSSDWIQEKLTDADPTFYSGPSAGRRAPDAPVVIDAKKTTLFEAMADTEFHLLAFGEKCRPVSFARVHAIERRPENETAFARYGVTSTALYLIRPDGHIAFRSFGGSLEPLLEFAKTAFSPE